MQITDKHVRVQPVTQELTPQKHGLAQTFASLRHRNFRLFWLGQLISLTGTWMQTTGQSWLVLRLTHSAWLLGVVGALQFVPVMLFSLFGGVVADRLPKRTVLLFTQSFAALQAAVLWFLIFTQHVQLWHIFILALLLGATNALDMPTRQAFVVEMVGREDLPNAVALNSSVFNLARILGPGIGGLLIAAFGEAPLFLFNALSFLPVIAGIALIDASQLHAQPLRAEAKVSTLKSVKEGLDYVFRTPVIFLIIAVVGIISLFGINFNVILPLIANDVLNVGAAGYGFISAALGAGALLSALWLAWNSNKPSITHMLISGIFFGLFEALFALSHWYILSLLLIAAVGFAQITLTAMANTTIQMVTPNHLRGRIMSVYMLVFTGTNPIGNLAIGGMAHLFGAALTFFIGGVLSLGTAVVGWTLRKPAARGMAEQSYREE